MWVFSCVPFNPIIEWHFRTSWLSEDLEKCSGLGSTVLKQPLKCHRSTSWVLCPASHSSRHIPLTLSLQYVPNRLRMSSLLTVQGKSKVNLEEKEGRRQEECSFSDLLGYSQTRGLSPSTPLWGIQGQKAMWLLGLRFVGFLQLKEMIPFSHPCLSTWKVSTELLIWLCQVRE